MSFLNQALDKVFDRPKTSKDKEDDDYKGFRYPSALGDLEPGITSLLYFNIIESNIEQSYKRDRSSSFGDGAKYKNNKVIQLYMPALQENLQNEYTSDIYGFAGNMAQGASWQEAGVIAGLDKMQDLANKVGGASLRAAAGFKTVSRTSTIFYEKTNTRAQNFSYIFDPKREADVIEMIRIITTFRKYLLPKIDNDSGQSTYPKYWAIEERPIDEDVNANRKMPYFKFGPAALISVSTNYTPDQIWQTFVTGDPLQIQLDLQFQELFILSQDEIYNEDDNQSGF